MPKVTTPEPAHIPRPPNRWILYRADKVRELEPLPGQPRRPQSEISKLISQMWAAEPAHVKAEYENRAIQAKIQHARDYPEYQYLPQSKESRQQKRQEKKEQLVKDRLAARQVRARTQRPAPPPYTTVPYSHYAAVLNHMPPEVRFGPAGPSPPLSAASTPEVAPVPLPAPSSASPQPVASTSQLPSTLGAPTPVFTPHGYRPPSASLPTPSSSASSSSSFSPAEPAAPWATPDSWRPTPAPHTPSPAAQGEEDHRPGANGLHVPTPLMHADEMINFTIPSLADGDLRAGWAVSGPGADAGADAGSALALTGLAFDAHNFAGLLTATADPALFTIPELDSSFLLEQPLGPVEATLGEVLPAPAEPAFAPGGEGLFADFDWASFGAPADGADALAPDAGAAFAPDALALRAIYPSAAPTPAPEFCPPAAHDGSPGAGAADMLAYLNFGPLSRSVSAASVSSSASTKVDDRQRHSSPGYAHTGTGVAFAQHHACPAPGPSSGYAPPSGAWRFNERRVAGSWHPSQLPS